MGKTIGELFRTKYLTDESSREAWQKLFHRGHWQGEVRQYRRDGTELCILGSITLLKDDADTPIGIVAVNHDITERKRTEEALQKSAAEFADLYNNAPCGYHSLDKNGVVIQINNTELHWLGYQRAEVVGQLNFADILTPQSRETFQANFPSFQARGEVHNLEFDLICKAGNSMTILLSATAIYDKHRAYLSSVPPPTILLSLSGCKKPSKPANSVTACWQTISPIWSHGVNPTGEYTYVSPSVQTVMGYTPEEIVGQSRYDFVHPDDCASLQQSLSLALAQQTTPAIVTYRKRHKAGHYIWLETKSQVIYAEATGEVLEIIVSSRDVTERKQAEAALRESEEKFRRLVEVAPMAIIMSEQSGRITLVNDQAELLFGYPRSELLGELVEILVPTAVRSVHPQHRAVYMAEAQVGKIGIGRDLFAQHKDGSQFPVEIELSYIETTAGLMVMSFITDITERRQAAKALHAQRDFLQQVIDSVPDLIMVKERTGQIPTRQCVHRANLRHHTNRHAGQDRCRCTFQPCRGRHLPPPRSGNANAWPTALHPRKPIRWPLLPNEYHSAKKPQCTD